MRVVALTCKNCGGNISLDANLNLIICDSCGAQQTLTNVLADESENFIYNEDELSRSSLNTYKRALSMMSSARTESSFFFAAGVFEEIPNVLNAGALAMECREKADLFKRERIYNSAVIDMKSDDPARIEGAIQAFKSLGEYKDSVAKTDECMPLLSVAQANHQEKLRMAEEQRVKEEKQKRMQAKRNKFIGKLISLAALAVATILIFGYFSIYSSSNIKISLSPDTENYLTEGYNKYVFCYDAKIENDGFLDVSAIEGEIIIEKDNEVLVDTTMSFYNYSSAVVRSKKSSKFTWELTVYSYDTALALYETDFDDLDVKIDITSITYTNGKTKTY